MNTCMFKALIEVAATTGHPPGAGCGGCDYARILAEVAQEFLTDEEKICTAGIGRELHREAIHRAMARNVNPFKRPYGEN